MTLMALYGSLRTGEFNHAAMLRRFGDHAMHQIDKISLKGLEMYSLGPYPVAVPRAGEQIEVEIFEVSDQCAMAITGMELGAGYIPIIRFYDDEPVVVFIQMAVEDTWTKVEGGDWSKHVEPEYFNDLPWQDQQAYADQTGEPIAQLLRLNPIIERS